jgi:hypothetical protein
VEHEDFQEIKGWRSISRYPATHPSNAPVIGNSVRFESRDLTTTPSLLSIEGEDFIEEAALETDIYIVDAPYDELLWIESIIELKMGSAQMVGSGGAAVQRQLAINWEDERERLLEQPSFQMAPVPKALQPVLGPPVYGGAHYGPDDR